MDSENGGIPSPVIKTNEGKWIFVPLPIPSRYEDDTKYSELNVHENIFASDLLKDLGLPTRKYETCHNDPDINSNYINNRPLGWKANFGQVKSAESHLENMQIGLGDIFLFFGWFKKVEFKNGKFCYIKDKVFPNGFHAIYGYLQIGEILKPNISSIPSWLEYHSHFKYKTLDEFNNANNTIYVANEIFSDSREGNKKGANFFHFNEELILTKENQPNRTLWRLPLSFHPNNQLSLSYNPKERWKLEKNNALLNSAAKGQEFVFSGNSEPALEWGIDLINKYSK